MEIKKKLDKTVHGKGQRINSNMHRVVVYLYNPMRKGSLTGRGSKDFKTTHTFNEINTLDQAVSIINQFAEGRNDGRMNYSMIKRAQYNGECIINDGVWLDKS